MPHAEQCEQMQAKIVSLQQIIIDLIGDIPSRKGEGEWPRPCIVCIEKGGSGAVQLDWPTDMAQKC